MGEKVKKLKKWQKIVIVVLAIVLVVVGGFFVFRKQIGDLVLTDEEKVVLHFYNDAQECIKRTGIDAQLYDIVYYEYKKVYNEGEKKKVTQPDGTLIYENRDAYDYTLQAYYVYDDYESYNIDEQYEYTQFREALSYSVNSEGIKGDLTNQYVFMCSTIDEVINKLRSIDHNYLRKNCVFKRDINDTDWEILPSSNTSLAEEISNFKACFEPIQKNYGDSSLTASRKQLSNGDIPLLKIKLFSDYPF